jgi:hypothetical protein
MVLNLSQLIKSSGTRLILLPRQSGRAAGRRAAVMVFASPSGLKTSSLLKNLDSKLKEYSTFER